MTANNEQPDRIMSKVYIVHIDRIADQEFNQRTELIERYIVEVFRTYDEAKKFLGKVLLEKIRESRVYKTNMNRMGNNNLYAIDDSSSYEYVDWIAGLCLVGKHVDMQLHWSIDEQDMPAVAHVGNKRSHE